MEEKNLTLICEGQVHTVEYMHKNRVYPKTVVFDCAKFKEISPYLNKKDEVLVVINGATDFSLALIYSLIKDLELLTDKVADITILSNIDLGKISTSYYLYTGDLFYGEVKEIHKGKIVTPTDGVKKSSLLKSLIGKKNKSVSEEVTENKDNKLKVNDVMSKFLVYNDKRTKLTIHGITKKSKRVYSDEYEERLVNIDLFK